MLALALTATLLAAPPPRALIVVSSPQAPAARTAVFQATRILDIEMTAVFARSLPGDHVLELKTFTPRGHLYQVLTVPFTGAAASRRPGFRRVRGYPRPLPERLLRRGAAGYEVSGSLPVGGGTWIVTNALYGRWRVDAFVDGQPVGRTAFTIAP
jgi:hypothetical protein